eukprot:PhF_6_TR37566/c0_g2_i1/m.55667/K10392/KIF1; kinesin family member 1
MSSIDTSGDNVKVVCRVRPFNHREIALQSDGIPLRSVIAMHGRDTIFLDHKKEFSEIERFKFDFSIWSIPESQQSAPESQVCSQKDVFEMVGEPTLHQCWDGYNTCFFAYGQTGAGKTYTMMGNKDQPGIIPRLCQELFLSVERQKEKNATATPDNAAAEPLKEYIVEARFMEIYNERVQDLLWELNPEYLSHTKSGSEIDRTNLKVRLFPDKGPDVVGITTITVQNWEECMQLIETGINNRTVAATKMNDESSRSHSIFRLSLTQHTKILPKKQFEKLTVMTRSSMINLVDLAGSERNKKSQAQGQQLKEAAAINKSLTCLKQVIDALVERKTVIPYRDSLLTWLLSESLGGNSKTFMLACVSPHYDNAEETLNTLRYALRTQGIQCKAQINDSDDMKKMERLKGELAKLQEEMEKGPSQDLQQQFADTQAEIDNMSAKLHDVQYQAEELKKAYLLERNIKYARAFKHGYSMRKERRLTAGAESEARKLLIQLSGRTTEKQMINQRLDSTAREVNELKDEESELLESIEQQQNQLSFWRSSTTKNQEIQQELRIIQQQKELDQQRKDNERKLAATIATMSNDQLRKDMQEKVKELVAKQERRVEAVIRKHSSDYEFYAEESCVKQVKLESEIERLRVETKDLRAKLAKENANFRESQSKLEKHAAFTQRETLQQGIENQKQYNDVVTERSNAFDSKQRDLKSKISQANEEWRIRHEMAMADKRKDYERLEIDAQGDMDDCVRRGEHNLREVNKRWEQKIRELEHSKRAEFESYIQLNDETEDFLRQVAMCERMRSVTLEQVEKVLSDPRLQKLQPKSEAYMSIPPAVYSLQEPVDQPIPTITAITNHLIHSTPRIVSSRVGTKMADTHAARYGEKAAGHNRTVATPLSSRRPTGVVAAGVTPLRTTAIQQTAATKTTPSRGVSATRSRSNSPMVQQVSVQKRTTSPLVVRKPETAAVKPSTKVSVVRK